MTARDVLDRIEQRACAADPAPWKRATPGSAYLMAPADEMGVYLGKTFVAGWGLTHEQKEARADANAEFIAHSRGDVDRLVAALRAVLDIHKPATVGPRTVCDSCLDSYEDYVDYPCPEVAAITEALGGGA